MCQKSKLLKDSFHLFKDKTDLEMKMTLLEKEKADLSKRLEEAKTHSKRQAEVWLLSPTNFFTLSGY